MVIKLADIEMKKDKKTKTRKRKAVSFSSEEIVKLQLEKDDPDLPEGESKKAKSDVEEEILKIMSDCDIILASTSKTSSMEAKQLECLSELFQIILEKNVNIVLITSDFPTWVKNSISILLNNTTKVSVQFFDVLTLAVKIAPAIFEALLEKTLNIALFYPRVVNPTVQESCETFMEFIVNTFDKLRRFPKFIAKFLCCVRDNLKPEINNKNFGNIMCPKFRTAIASVTNLLTVGQITDLWKTLQHNLEVECVKPLREGTNDSKTKSFLGIVVDLFVEFLSNIKVTDYTIPGATIEKICEMMDKLVDECLKPFGFVVVSSKEKLDLELVNPYLSLVHAYGQLHGIMLCYNLKYKGNNPVFNRDNPSVAADLSYLHPFMDSESWINLSTRILKYEDSSCIQLLVNLVAQKLTFMTALGQKSMINKEVANTLQSNSQELKEAAEFIWTHQNKNCIQFSDETLTLISQYIEPTNIIQLAASYIKQFQDEGKFRENEGLSSTSSVFLSTMGNPTFHYALILEALAETMRRIWKMNLLSKPIKKILKDILSSEARTILISESKATSSVQKICKNSNAIMESFLSSVNSILEDSMLRTNNKNMINEDFSSRLIDGMIKYVSDLDIETYPKDVKTVVFLCSIVILTALLEQKLPSSDNSLLPAVLKLVVSSGSQAQGNEILFSVHWVKLFQWYKTKVVEEVNEDELFSSKERIDLCNMILGNVFMSSKFMSEFEEEIEKMCDATSKLNSYTGQISLTCLEYLLKELQSTKTNKLTLPMQDHCTKITKYIVQKIDKIADYSSINSLSNYFRACWLTQLAIDRMDQDILNLYKNSLPTKIKRSLKYLKASTSEDDEEMVNNDDKTPIVYAIRFLHAVCKSQMKIQDNLPSEFLSKLWKCCLNPNVLQYNQPSCISLKVPKNFVKDIFEVSNASDFQLICNSLMEKTTALANTSQNFKEINMIVQILAELVDAEVTPENKPIRRHTLQECLHKILVLTLDWDVSDNTCLNSAIIPYLKLKTKILRRRGAMVNLRTLALCLTSVTSISLVDVKDSSTFKLLFCTLADLLNALIVHRLDVIAFRSHIFLQCFQYLIENLTRRADQKNKLSDGEILNVRTCAHSIERLCQSMKLGQKEFSRVSPYFITILIKQFELLAVYPAVKVPLLAGCYKLLDLCDDHGISQLNSLLSIGSKEILKTIYEQYKKFYQYKGRV